MLTAVADEREGWTSTPRPRARAEIYHFFELALAHPGEAGHEFFASREAEHGLTDAAASLPHSVLLVEALEAGRAFLMKLQATGFEEVESAHIALFSSNFPVVPCPPYGSLFTVEEPKRLEEMVAIKEFYRDVGIEIAPGFDDLPDHICVELEVMHLLSFRESQASTPAIAEAVRAQQRLFADRFMLPFVERLSDIACRYHSANPYAHILKATYLFLADHRAELRLAPSAIERHVQ